MPWSRRGFLRQSGINTGSDRACDRQTLVLHGEHCSGRRIAAFRVADELQKDFDGTLQRVHAIGYKEVEMAGFFGKKPTEIKTSLDNAGLHCASVHIFDPGPATDTMDYAVAIGAKYVITALYLLKREPDDNAI